MVEGCFDTGPIEAELWEEPELDRFASQGLATAAFAGEETSSSAGKMDVIGELLLDGVDFAFIEDAEDCIWEGRDGEGSACRTSMREKLEEELDECRDIALVELLRRLPSRGGS